MYHVLWDNGFEACDSVRKTFDNLFEAKQVCYEIYNDWIESMLNKSADDWNYMIYNAYAYVAIYDEENDSYESVWEPSDKDLAEIGWVEKEI